MTRVLAPGPLRRTILLIVMLAWLLSQALGLVHRVVHPGQVDAALESFAVQPALSMLAAHGTQADVHDHESVGGQGLERLFVSHGHDAGACQLYDQLAHADLLWSPPADSCSAAVTDAVQPDRPAWHLAAQAAGYLARGPPPSA